MTSAPGATGQDLVPARDATPQDLPSVATLRRDPAAWDAFVEEKDFPIAKKALNGNRYEVAARISGV